MFIMDCKAKYDLTYNQLMFVTERLTFNYVSVGRVNKLITHHHNTTSFPK